MAQDYYQTLGISKAASPEDIKKAYRRLAHQYHPDKGEGGDAEKFKQVSEAYQVLSDPEKRKQYDQFGTAFQGGRGQGGFSGWEDFAQGFGYNANNVDFEDAFDIFSDIFGGGSSRRPRRERGIDLEMDIELSFIEAVFGVEKEITLEKKDVCERCEGSGAETDSKINTCPKCHGVGQIRTARRTIFGQMSSVATCDRCDGSGKIADNPCKECQGLGTKRRVKKLNVKIPAGVDHGMRIRIANEGEVGYRGSNYGDLYLRILVADHPKFKRDGEHILSEVPISFYQAALGTEIDTDTVDGTIKVKIPAGTQSGRILRVKGKGVPQINGGKRGDHLITVTVVTPTKLTKKEKDLFKKLADEAGESVNVDEGFWSRFTS
ncbi:MAG TPA: molecular chaperone DnaJ [Verrucomicrobiae bacterium]|nr:molecular chaperone DnaJ [Verrucomicrobiae bacterium]